MSIDPLKSAVSVVLVVIVHGPESADAVPLAASAVARASERTIKRFMVAPPTDRDHARDAKSAHSRSHQGATLKFCLPGPTPKPASALGAAGHVWLYE